MFVCIIRVLQTKYLTCCRWTLLSTDFLWSFSRPMLLMPLNFVKITSILIYPLLRLKSEERYFWRVSIHIKVKVKADIALNDTPSTGRRLPYRITQCYLPPDTSERAPPNPSHAGWYSIYLPRRDGRLSWPSWLDSAPTGSRTSDLSITSPNCCTTNLYTKIGL